MGTIYTLWIRQLKRYYRSRSRMIGTLGNPLLFLVAFSYGFGPIFQRAGEGTDYITFLAPGIIGISILMTAMASGTDIIWDRQFGFLKETFVAPVSRLQVMFGRTLGGATVAVLQGIVVLFIAMFLGFRFETLLGFFLSLAIMLASAIAFTAFAIAIASLIEDVQGYQFIMNFLVMPMVFLSGSVFPLNDLPKSVKIIAHFDPLSYSVDGLRSSLAGIAYFDTTLNLIVLGLLTVVFLIFGSWAFSRIRL